MEQEGHFRTRDGLEFFERRWLPDGAFKANLVLLHGYGEHCSRYGYVGETMNAAGIGVFTYDQRGHGRSPGKPAYIRNFDAFLSDLDDYLEYVRPCFEGRPWFFMGHSMGGLVLARYLETREVDAKGVVFSSPFLAFSDDVPKFLLALAGVLGAFAPWLPVGAVDNRYLARDPEARAAADADPYCFHGRILARSGSQLQKAIEAACAGLDAITHPIYITHGGDDHVVSPKGAHLLNEKCRSEDKTFKIYDDGYHEMWNDYDKETVVGGIRDWLTARI